MKSLKNIPSIIKLSLVVNISFFIWFAISMFISRIVTGYYITEVIYVSAGICAWKMGQIYYSRLSKEEKKKIDNCIFE